MKAPLSEPPLGHVARSRLRGPAGFVLALVGLALLVPVGLVAARLLGSGGSPDPGRLTEQLHPFGPGMGPLPSLVDVTAEWGLGAWRESGSREISGGVAVGDLDGDGLPDVVAGGGTLGVFFGTGTGFERAEGAPSLPGRDVASVGLSDVDGDGRLDLMVGATSGDDAVVWGGSWAQARAPAGAEVTALDGAEPTTGLIAAELTGDGRTDLLRLGYGGESPAEDLVFEQIAPRRFASRSLPGSDRLSLAAEVADVDADGLLDLWVTRDVGWRNGGDQIFSRRGGSWQDIAPEVGADLEIDGMGVALADLTGEGQLDAYLSDIGENDLLAGRGAGFEPATGAGVGRIRPPGAPQGLVSSSWASGVADLNLDGRLDLVVANGGFRERSVPNKVRGTEVVVDDAPAIFLGDGRGRFADVWPDIGLPVSGAFRGMALADLDADGDTDVVLVAHGEGLRALRNDAAGPSLTVRPGPCSSSGAVVRVSAGEHLVVQLLAQHTFLGAHAPEVIVGVGEQSEARLRVEWPGEGAIDRTVSLSGGRLVRAVGPGTP